MPKITFQSNNKKISIAVQGGTELLAVHRRAPELPLKFGCTHGDCGVCAIKIAEGNQNLSHCSRKERETLQKKGLDDSYRLACQCAVNGNITIMSDKVISDE